MKKILQFLRQETVLSVAFVLALISSFIVHPDSAWLAYPDYRTLALLFCLMIIVAGLQHLGVFALLGQTLIKKAHSLRMLYAIMILLCFFSSMIITNDVSLITFVPFTILVFRMVEREDRVLKLIVLETIAANLGSMATPIGNLGDLSPRGVQTLQEADFIAAEDTRVSMKLLNHFGVKKPLISYHEHNHVTAGQSVLNRLLAGESCALMTDAGTPAISDPGEDLVRLCAENGVEVRAIPGCCAAVNALAVSGLPTGRFTFEGFLTVNKKSRREHLNSLKDETRTMIFHEAPHKLRTTLNDLMEAFGPDRRISLCRELTKLHEEVLRFTLAEAVAYYEENAPKGEYVLVVAGAAPKTGAVVTLEDGVAQVLTLKEQGMRLKDAAIEVAEHTGLSKNELYAAVLER